MGRPENCNRRSFFVNGFQEGNAEIEGKVPKTWTFFDRRAAVQAAAVRKIETKRAMKQSKKAANAFQGRKQPRGGGGGMRDDDELQQGQQGGRGKRRKGGDDSSDDE